MTLKERLLNREGATGVLSAAFGAFMLSGYDQRFGVFPKAIFILMIAMGALMLLTVLALPSARRTPLEKASRYELCFIAVLVCAPRLITLLGFYPASYLVIFAISLLAPNQRSGVAIAKNAAYSLFVTGATWLVFSGLLKIRMPAGLLF